MNRYLLSVLVAAGAALSQSAILVAQTRDTVAEEPSLPAESRARVLLDVPVDRATYRLGPGDEITVSMFGDINRVFTLPIGPEGAAVIPSIAVVPVLGLTIDQAQAAIQTAVSRLYRSVSARVNIAGLRSFKVYVLGDVPDPGVRIANAATRVSELVPQLFPAGDQKGNTVTRRTVSLRRTSGDTIRLDLLPFLFRGDMTANPIVNEGDVLIIPTLDETVRIHGRVSYPGRYEFRSGESLAAFLENVNGRSRLPADAAGVVSVARGQGEGRENVTDFTEQEAFGARGSAFTLRPFDVVFVPQIGDFMRDRTARVQGQVARPGVYPITPNVTTAHDLIQLAGGLLPDASLNAATLQRTGAVGRATPDSVPVESLTDAEIRARRALSLADASNVVVDFEQLMSAGGGAGDVKIEPGDVLTIPRRSNEVAVLGAVATPGLLRYVPGRVVSYYLEQAGGALARADKGAIIVLKAKLGTEVSADDVRSLEPGDQIVVPYKRNVTAMQRFQLVSTVLSGISGIVLTILAVRQVF